MSFKLKLEDTLKLRYFLILHKLKHYFVKHKVTAVFAETMNVRAYGCCTALTSDLSSFGSALSSDGVWF